MRIMQNTPATPSTVTTVDKRYILQPALDIFHTSKNAKLLKTTSATDAEENLPANIPSIF
jgi:hypothetical protein